MKEKDQGFDNFQTKPIASMVVTMLVDIKKLGGYFWDIFFVLYELDRSNLRLPIGKVV